MMPLGPSFMREFKISATEFSVLVSAYTFSAAISGGLIGFFADRFDRKTLFLVTYLGFIVGTLMCGLATSFESMAMARVIAGAFGGVLNSMTFSILPELIPVNIRGKATGIVMSSFSFASVIGVPLGLTIAVSMGARAPFYAIAAISVLIFLIASKVIPPINQHLTEPQIAKSHRQMLKNYFSILTNRNYWKAFGVVVLLSFGTFTIVPFISPYAVNNLKISEADLRYIYLLGGICTAVSSRVIGQFCDKYGYVKVFIALCLLAIIPINIYTNLHDVSLPAILLVTSIFMTLASGRFVPSMALMTRIPSQKERGAFMSIFTCLRSLALALATATGGVIIHTSGTGELLHYNIVGIIASILSVLAIPLFISAHRFFITKNS